MSIFGDIEDALADLYPYRIPITIGLVVALALGLAIAYRRGWHLVVWRNKLPSVIIGIPLLGASLVAGNYFLSPLWERNTVCEASPIARAGAGSEKCADEDVVAITNGSTPAVTGAAQASAAASERAGTPALTFEARVVQRGQFRGADSFHTGSGDALIIETAPETYTLRFENFSVRNGPDLFVYLSTTVDGGYDGALKIGKLKGTDGAFNYNIPAGTDLSQFKSVIVWCDPFGVLFAVAPLAEA